MPYGAVDWIGYNAYATPDQLAMVEADTGRRFTYAEMDVRVGRVAAMLRDKGLKPGDRAAYLTLNSTDTLEFIFGCWRAGVIAVAINFRLTPPEIAVILSDSGTRLTLHDTPFAPIAEALADRCEWLHTQGTGADSPYEQALAAVDPVMEFHPQGFEDQCLLMYSSGTTGTPKGVMITHGMMYFSQVSGFHANGLDKDSVSLSNMPLFHIGGLNVTAMPSLWSGTTTVVMRLFDIEKTLDYIDDPALGITALFMVPAAYNAMKQHPKVETTDFSRIRIAYCGAETVPEELIRFWATKGLIIQEGYGMTETAAPGCSIAKSDMPHMAGWAGKSLMHSTLSIRGEDGVEKPPGETGEIWITGNNVSPGYWNRPEATAEVFVTLDDGRRYYRTGDVGRQNEDGYFAIEDRVKDMYISGGENVYPAEIENHLYELPEIAEVAVIGVPDARWGEVGCICAVAKPDAELELDTLLAHLDGKLATFKTPRHLHVMDALPRGGTGKVLKYQLRETVPGALGL